MSLQPLLDLAHELGREERGLVILGEGNISAKTGHDTFVVKASGHSLPTLGEAGLTQCRFEPLLDLMNKPSATDGEVEAALLASRVDTRANKPSVEAMFHAWLLTLPDIDVVAHVHSVHVGGLVCSPRAAEFAERRMFPDEIVCCGAKSLLLPYVDPGLELAKALTTHVPRFREEQGVLPRVILLRNHGLIAPAKTPAGALAAVRMAEKSAAIFLGAASAGGPVFLEEADVQRIAGRDDEAYRRRQLGLD